MLNKYIVKIVCIQGIFYRKGAFTAGDGELINDVKVTNDIGITKYINTIDNDCLENNVFISFNNK